MESEKQEGGRQEVAAASEISAGLGESKCEHGLLLSCCDECKNEALDIARRVYQTLEGDGYYGPYVLGEELWNEFRKAFKDA